MNYHSTLSTRTLMKVLGLDGIRRGSGGTGTVDPTFLGAWKKSTHIGGVWAGHIFGPDELNVPRWNGSPEENARLVRAATRHFGAGVVAMLWWTHARAIAVMWYVWLMGACALALFTLTVQHFFASFAESEPRVAWIGALLMGVPSLILAGLTFWLILIT
jgi:hypothetical protein